MGTVNKIQMGWDSPFWGKKPAFSLEILWTEHDLPEDKVGVYSFK